MNAAQEEARRRMVAFRDDMVSQGWTLVRDNEDGGALVIEHEGNRVVVSMHGYEIKDLPPTPEPENLESSPGNDAEPTEKVPDEALDA